MKIKFYKSKDVPRYRFLNVMYEAAIYSRTPSVSYMALNVIRQRSAFQRTEQVLKEVIK
jgi:hypothetical protein